MKNPGWIDLQVNGHAGVDYSEATLSEESFLRSAEALINDGTEIFCPTIVTGTLERFTRNAAVIRQAVEKHGLQKNIPGLHFEGPFISNTPGAVGAHDPALTLIPTAENVEKLLAAAPGFVTIVTLGADVEMAPEATALLTEKGVIVSTGHHVANYAQIRNIAANGGQLLTHLGNGCPNLVGRHENPIYAGMAEDRLTAMIITDGHHLPGELIKLICRAKGVDKVIVTSDATSLTGMKPGKYVTLGQEVVLEANGKLHIPERQCLAGSASTMAMCMNFLESLDFLTEAELFRLGRGNALDLLRKNGFCA
ncbi:MAG: amidohydrolase family protein [Lentisphaeria bacterium]|nr:amidohydrolase family protein [Lentisphaeria bacterium]